LHLSAGVERLLGLKRDDILRDAGVLYRQIDQRQWDELAAAEAVSLRELSDLRIELRICRHDGDWRWLQISSRPRHKGNGTVVWDGMATDVTARREAEEALRQERDFSTAALDSLPGVFYVYDEQLRFLRWNRNFEQVLGYSGAEVAGMTPLDFFAGTDKQLLAERIREVFVHGAAEVEADFVAKDGTRRPYYFTGIRVAIADKPCLLGVGIDISKRREAETALVEKAAELMRRNQELERFDRAAVGRELIMIELKRQINALSRQLGAPPPYDLSALATDEAGAEAVTDPEPRQ
jgi:PAS domain S-box-containing protein